MTQADKYKAFLLERIAKASSFKTKSAYQMCYSAFNNLYQVDVEMDNLETQKLVNKSKSK